MSPCKTCGKPAKDVLCWKCWKKTQVTRSQIRNTISLKFKEIYAITGVGWHRDEAIAHLESPSRSWRSNKPDLLIMLDDLLRYKVHLTEEIESRNTFPQPKEPTQ